MRKFIAIIAALGLVGSVTLPEVLAAPVSKSSELSATEFSSAAHEKKAMDKPAPKKKAAKKSKKTKSKSKAKPKAMDSDKKS